MSDRQFSALVYAVAADVVRRLCAGGMNLREALRSFYSSRLYAVLDDQETGLWREPTPVLLSLLEKERRTGNLSLEWSE